MSDYSVCCFIRKQFLKTCFASVTPGCTKKNNCYQQLLAELPFPDHYVLQNFRTKVSYPFVPAFAI